jgi:hypothetical protein
MLYKETVETTTLELLASLQQEEILSIFFFDRRYSIIITNWTQN